jgi:hypothetical protein
MMRYDRIDYHPPAFKRMRGRNINRRQIERCLQNPDREGSSETHPDNIQAEFDTELSTLIVWYKPLAEKHVLVMSVLRTGKK